MGPHLGSRYTYMLYVKLVGTGLDQSRGKTFKTHVVNACNGFVKNGFFVHITGTCFFVQWKMAVVQ